MTNPYVSDQDRSAVAEGREAALQVAADESSEPVHQVEDVDAGGVPARLFTPAAARGALLYLHGGGFVFGDLTTHDPIGRRLANRTGWAVLLVDYRRAPEHPWPAAGEDAAAAADWLASREPERLAVVGDSAGATLALSETMRHPDRFAGQVLVYPFVDPSGATYDRELPGIEFDPGRAEWYWNLYLQGADASSDHALHVLDREVAGLPPTLVQLAEHDVLTTRGRLLAEHLSASGVAVTTSLYPRVQHGFWRYADNDQSEPALAEIATFLAGLG